MSDSVLAIVTNYKRPRNVKRIVEILRQQTHPVRIMVVDNSDPHGNHEARDLGTVDDIWRFGQNAGPPCRFAPAWMQHDCKYILFVDDDLLPGRRAVKHCVQTAQKLDGKFATLGQFGRRFHGGGRDYMKGIRGRGPWRYVAKNIGRSSRPMPVDMTCRIHFVRADCMQHVLNFKWDMLDKFGDDSDLEGDRRGWWREDDMLLSLGIQRATGWRSYLIPKGPPQASLRHTDLPANNAHSSRAHHNEDRSRCIRMAMEVGWETLWHKAT